MTLIASRDGVLVADSIRYTNSRDRSGKKITSRISDEDVCKIEMPSKPTIRFEGQRVIAIARCGTVKLTTALIKDIENGDPILEKHAQRVKDGTYRHHWRASLVILTQTTTWIVRVRARSGSSVKVIDTQDKPVSVGEGSKIAEYFMQEFDFSAELAVSAGLLGAFGQKAVLRQVERKGVSKRTWTRGSAIEEHEIHRVQVVEEMSQKLAAHTVKMNAEDLYGKPRQPRRGITPQRLVRG